MATPIPTTIPDPGIFVTAHWLAGRYLSARELPGDLDNPHIRAWLMDCGFGTQAHDEIAWCGAFVRHIAWLLDLPIPAFPARARYWLTVGTPIDLADAQIGFDIVILARGGGKQPGSDRLDASGHVGWFGGFDDGGIVLRGGNQQDRVSDGVFDPARHLGTRRLL